MSPPVFSLVVPCYKVAEYLPTFFASLNAQSKDLARGEIVFVIDGCPEGSQELAEAWMAKTPIPAKVVFQENRGLSEARNTGIRHSSGKWVSFPDPDDEFGPGYIAAVLSAIEDYPAASMLVTRLSLHGPDGKPRSHPLDYKFDPPTQTRFVSLVDNPEMIHLQAASAFFDRGLITDLGLTFSPLLKANFEDAHFIARLLERLPLPSYVVVPEAEYIYKQRADGSSLVAQSKENYARYINLTRNAYLPLLEAYSKEKNAPQWLGNLLLYDIWWLFRASLQMHSSVFALPDEVKRELNDSFREVLERIGRDTIRAFRVVSVHEQVRAAWEVAAAGRIAESAALVREYDRQLRLQRIVYFSADPGSQTEIIDPSGKAVVVKEKTMAVEFLGQTWVRENIVWVSGLDEGDVGTEGNGYSVRSSKQEMSFGGEPLFEWIVRVVNETRPLPRPAMNRRKHRFSVSKLKQRFRRLRFVGAFRLGAISGYSRRFQNAWAIMDRDNQANDNGEALYRYVKNNRPDINAWFVINREAPDYERLKGEGFRLVPYGSKRHFLLMKGATVLASSQADAYVVTPFPRNVLTKTWNYAFLQHGVVHNSLHRWLNPKDIQLLVASTQPEYDAFVREDGLYKYTDKEVHLTGQPRHDKLWELNQGIEKNSRRATLVVMPTWRNYLLSARRDGGNERIPIEGFSESEFVQQWTSLLNGDYFSQLARDPSIDVFLLPHPNIDAHWTDMTLPEGVERISYSSGDAQGILARATLTLTDYSSQAFEGAFVGAPTVYFQFDRDTFFAGDHIAAPGYFEHDRDGFGPVCATVMECEHALRLMKEKSHPEFDAYMSRVDALYPLRDGQASQRVVAALENLGGTSSL